MGAHKFQSSYHLSTLIKANPVYFNLLEERHTSQFINNLKRSISDHIILPITKPLTTLKMILPVSFGCIDATVLTQVHIQYSLAEQTL